MISERNAHAPITSGHGIDNVNRDTTQYVTKKEKQTEKKKETIPRWEAQSLSLFVRLLAA